MIKRICTIIVILLFSACLTACFRPDGKGNADEAPELVHFEPVTEVVEGRKDIYLILKVIDSNYWQVIIKGAKAAGADLGCNVYCGGTTNETDWKGQHVLVEEALSKDPDAVIISPDDSTEIAVDVDKIHSCGLPVILIDTAANTESFDTCFMTDNILAGQNAAEEMLSELASAGHGENEELSVGIMVGYAKSFTINERLAGFYQYWANHAPEKWTIASDIMNCNGDIENGKKLTEAFLAKHPEVSGLYGTNNTPTRALCSMVKEKGRTDVAIVGFDYSDELRELIESPEYNASSILQRQYDMGYFAVETAMNIFDGIAPPVKFKDTGVVKVNRENLKDPEVAEVLKLN